MEAKRIIAYYFKLLFEASDLKWDGDNDAEIEAAIEAIIKEAKSKDENK